MTLEEDGSDGSDDNDDEKYEFDQLMLDNQPAGKVYLIIQTLFFHLFSKFLLRRQNWYRKPITTKNKCFFN